MCGLLGAFHTEGRNPAVDLARGARVIARRGPDSLKHWVSPNGRIEIVHARLAIVDEGGLAHQPLTDTDTGTTVAFNGEIYNYPELRAELDSYPYRTQSDTEAILAAYRQWGLGAFSRLNGMFSLVLMDGPSGALYLVRDAVGKKPLFVANWTGSILFGSSALALTASSSETPSFDADAIADYWADGHVAPTRSLFRGCRPVLPGEIIRIHSGGSMHSTRLAAPPDRSVGGTVREQLSELLQRSVALRLRDNPHPVSLLSGGIDSTVVTAALQKATSQQTLTLGSLIPRTLDERYARHAARRLNVPLTIVSPSIGRIEEEVDFSLELQDEPLGMMSFLPLALLLRAVKPHGRILFAGDGGDEVFLGYGLPSDWIGAPTASSEREITCGPPLPPWMSAWGRRTVTHALVGHMFAKLDRASAEQGIEVRCPLLDWNVMAFARRLDPDVLLGSNRPKHLLKDQLTGWSSWLVDRPKMGFTYNLRWAWALRAFAGLRDRIDPDALTMFAAELPAGLRSPASQWATLDIWRHFSQVWKLLSWSAFLRRTRRMPRMACLQKATA